MRRLFFCLSLAWCACPAPPSSDAGADAAALALACSSPESCAALGVDAVCRHGACRDDVPCGDDLECGLGERCLAGRCRFRGCVKDDDCPTNRCVLDSFSCVECGSDRDCPHERPVCNPASNTCVGCLSDAQCPPPGPGHCGGSGACVDCLSTDHCPSGLSCAATHTCVGALKSETCTETTSCNTGLVCITLNAQPSCLPSCNLFTPMCGAGEICFKLTYDGDTSLVFETDGPLGACYPSQPSLRGLREPCARTSAGSNCEPNLMCAPETATVSLCRAFCDPAQTGGCLGAEHCVPFVGDYNGRRYGLCLPDTGFGEACTRGAQCKAGLSCQPWDDPSSFTSLAPLCQFNVGAQPGLAPCGPRPQGDGGTLPADRVCQSGSCRGDPGASSVPPYFCYAGCAVDSDCDVGGRTGFCDSSFGFTSPTGMQGSVKGCRPGCLAESDCAGYDAGVTCRQRVQFSTPMVLKGTCSPPLGGRRGGQPCASAGECRSGFCLTEDSRQVARRGVCFEGCRAPADCVAPATSTTAPVTCAPTVVFGARGPDQQPNTPDDTLFTPSACAGAACQADADCSPDGGSAVCVPDVDPARPRDASVVLRCRPPTPSGSRVAGDACAADAECVSGVCGALQAPATGTGRSCFQACTTATVCPGTTRCRASGMRLPVSGGQVSVDSCAQ